MKYIELERKELFKNDHIKVFSKKLKLPNEEMVNWTFTGKKDAVGVVAILDDKILLVKQYRPAIEKEILEIPAGLIEKDEDPEVAAIRELEEETGYKAKNLEKLYEFYTSPGISAGKFYMYFTKDLEIGKQHLDPDEFLEVEKIPLKELDISMVDDVKSVLGVEYALSNRWKRNEKK